MSKSKSVGEKFDVWRARHKGSLDSMCDAYCAGHVDGHLMAQQQRDLVFDTLTSLRGATAALIEANESEIECRGDEDCDHCHCVALMAEVDKFIKDNRHTHALRASVKED